MVDLAEEVPDVGLEDELVAPDKTDPDLLQGIGGRPLRAEPEARGQEVGLEDGLEDDLGRLLAHAIAHSGDAQRPLGAIRLGDLHPPNSRRAVLACSEVADQLVEHPTNAVILHLRQRLSIDAGGTTIRLHADPRLPQHVSSVDAVIQGVEPALRRLLGRSP